MLYIFLNNIWQDWDYVHNSLGYSNQETETVSFKKADYDYWGQPYLNTGFHDGNFSDPLDGTYWADGIVGWYDINQLALNAGLFPSNAQSGPNVIRQKESGVSTQTVVLIDANQTKKYLLRGLLELGWLTEEEVDEAGWSFGVPICGVLTQTEDKVMNGTIPDRINIGGVKIKDGLLTENIIPESGVMKEYKINSIEVLLAVYMNRYTGEYSAYQIGVSDTQKGGPMTQEDKERIESFGLQLSGYIGSYGTPPYGVIVWDDSYTFEPVALYTDIDGEQLDTNGNAADMSNFECVKTNDWVYIKMKVQENGRYDHSPATMTWKCRITKNS